MSRALAFTRAEAPRAWRNAIDLSQVHCAATRRGAPLSRIDGQTFMSLVVRLQKTAFPLEHNTATQASAAFLKLASALVLATRQEDREALADFLVEGARCLDRLLSSEAQKWNARLTGERD
jgi:hypothetical protein